MNFIPPDTCHQDYKKRREAIWLLCHLCLLAPEPMSLFEF